jgi:outer membrane putative beta-barrel porin/alpha-amylase
MNPHVLTSVVLMLLSQSTIFAVSPLVTDDADTVDPGNLQVNVGWQLSRTGSVSLYSIPLNPVLGLGSRGELGAIFGYQWWDGLTEADGITDLTIATKWRLWHGEDNNFKVSARFDLKLPTASTERGLGTGETDTSVVLVATGCWGPTCLDWNIGYSAIGLSHTVVSDDHWFLGQAVRHELSKLWTIIGETFALLPQGDEGGSANVHLSVGVQLSLRENFLVSALIGSAAGSNSPDLTGYLGFTLVY